MEKKEEKKEEEKKEEKKVEKKEEKKIEKKEEKKEEKVEKKVEKKIEEKKEEKKVAAAKRDDRLRFSLIFEYFFLLLLFLSSHNFLVINKIFVYTDQYTDTTWYR